MSEYFDLSRFLDVIPRMLPFLGVTFAAVAVSMAAGTILAILLAMLRIRKIPVGHQLLGVFISFMRGTPMVVQMMIAYYGLPILLDAVGIDISDWDKIIFLDITLALNETAFLGEIFRSAIVSIPAVQTEAGYSIGMTRFSTFTRIVLPQTVRIVIPAFGIELISVFHSTSLGYMIGVIDLMGRAKTLGVATGHTLEAYIFAALIYIVISLVMRLIFTLLDKRSKYVRGQANVL